MFQPTDKNGKPIPRRRVALDFSDEEMLTEQSHRDSADINKIIKKHGMDMIAKTAVLKSAEYRFDDIEGNDFQEAMMKVAKAQQTFESMPHEIRAEFQNNPGAFMDFVQNPDNKDRMIELGLATAQPKTQPVEVVMKNPPTEKTPGVPPGQKNSETPAE